MMVVPWAEIWNLDLVKWLRSTIIAPHSRIVFFHDTIPMNVLLFNSAAADGMITVAAKVIDWYYYIINLPPSLALLLTKYDIEYPSVSVGLLNPHIRVSLV